MNIKFFTISAMFMTFGSHFASAKGQDKMTPAPSIVQPNMKEEAAKLADDPLRKSAISKKLEDKAFISTGMGFANVSGSKGTWGARMAGDLTIGYQVLKNLAGGSVSATARYAPIDVSIDYNEGSYKGVVETYNFGGLWSKKMGNMTAVGSAEVALLSISLYSQNDAIKEDSGLESGSFNIVAGGGADWTVLEKLRVGPRLLLGFGDLTTLQISAAASFVL